jgi:hypothetical protein
VTLTHQIVIEGERAKVIKGTNDINMVAEQRWAVARELCALEGEIGSLRDVIATSGGKLKEDLFNVQRQATDSQRRSQEQKAQAMADVRNAVRRLVTQLQSVVEENGHRMLAEAEIVRSKEQRGTEVGGLQLRVEVLEQANRGLSEAKELRSQSQEAPGLSNNFSELSVVVGLRGGGGSGVTSGLSVRGLENVKTGDWSDDFTFIIGDHRYRCPSSVAQFLSPRVSKLQLIDATISELKLEVDDGDDLFGSVLEAVGGRSIAIDSAHRQTFAAICTAFWNSELY